MLRIILNIIVLYVIVRAVRSLARGSGGFLGRVFGARRPSAPTPDAEPPVAEAYSKITPYDIEDAEYEEIRE